ncbi:hypothetical protein NP233_g3284 [Leucocoprinus birnbaumii]|uniref:Uncharacterized protein n=1 Tax=Leucocoprinus birnbaumii TaxID=56174 RepID=A0AAD5W0L5_9AGAR|nr:hypothetical protein NP233_g3284 [Leucocoprinus birnbaumii]
MSLADGRYSIITASPSVAPPPSPLGVDNTGLKEIPVVVNGANQTWVIKKTKSGNYTISVEAPNDANWRSFALDNDVFVDIQEEPYEWKVTAVKDPWKGFVIQVPEGGEHSVAWTIHSFGYGSPISLRPVELMPTAGQIWRVKKVAEN